MGATCCSKENHVTDITIKPLEAEDGPEEDNQANEKDDYKAFTKQPTQFTKAPVKDILVGPEVFVQLKKGDIHEQYSIGKKLGEGSICHDILRCLRVTHKKSGMLRALKSIKKDALFEEDQQKLFAEMNILKDLDHPNTVKLYELYQDENFYYLITEYLAGGELFEKIQSLKQFSETMAGDIMRQIMSAVAYCHSNNIVHRDLKPENIIFISKGGDSALKVIDFGTSRHFGSEKMTKRLGTPYYIAPEVLHKNYDEKCDIWSCGVILYIMLAGYPPFNGRSENEIFKRILSGKFAFHNEEWKSISPSVKELITSMLTLDPALRPSAKEVLNHPWMQLGNESVLIGSNVLANLQQFSARGKLRQLLLTFMASQMITEKEKDDLKKLFRSVDKNGDGRLSKAELTEAFRAATIEQNRFVENLDERIQQIVDCVDINKSGVIDYTEFIIAGLEQEKLLTENKIRQAFQMMDLNGNSFISKEELEQVMVGLDDQVWEEFLKECDSDNDGQISESEFIQILMSKV